MGKILEFKSRKADDTAQKLVEAADAIDEIILTNVVVGEIPARDMAAILAHRLGTMMNRLAHDEKERIWPICEEILRRQADIS